MGATIVFRGVVRASQCPEFVDHIVAILNPAYWGDAELLTFHLFPGTPCDGKHIYGTFAWRGEVFAYAFPSRETGHILIGHSSKKEEAVQRTCVSACAVAVEALAYLLDRHLQEQAEASERRASQMREDRGRIRQVATAKP